MATLDILITAARQYKHNDGNGFVFGYDKKEVDKIVSSLFGQIEKLKIERDDNDRKGCERCKIQTATECAMICHKRFVGSNNLAAQACKFDIMRKYEIERVAS